jgi:hypothetical protein
MRLAFTSSILSAFISLATPAAAHVDKGRGPSGTFRNSSGTLELTYAGEGMVDIALKTKYCRFAEKNGRAVTFVPNEAIEVRDKKNKPLMVIFLTKKKAVVWAQLERFKKRHCRVGVDATGIYKRIHKHKHKH